MESIRDRARGNPSLIVLPEAEDRRVVEAAIIVVKEHLARPVLIGARSRVEALAGSLGKSLGNVEIVDPTDSTLRTEYAEALYRRRKHKGLTSEEARALAGTPMYFGSLMVSQGAAHGIVAGAATSTADVLRALIHCIGTAEGICSISSAFLMVVPGSRGRERVFIFADASVIPDPTPEELAGIAIASAGTRKLLIGDQPSVAMLSFSTKGSATHPSADKVIEATQIAKRIDPHLVIDGELQVDAAIVPEVAERKAPASGVAGKANVLVFPNLDSANIGYKLVERLGGAKACGPLLQGLAKPASDLSRGCGVGDIVDVVAMTAAQKGMGA
jgi:phosphate acetyltransferase